MSLLDFDGSPPLHAAAARVSYHTSQYIMALWGSGKSAEREEAMIQEISSLFREGAARPGQSVSELVAEAAHRLAYREEHG